MLPCRNRTSSKKKNLRMSKELRRPLIRLRNQRRTRSTRDPNCRNNLPLSNLCRPAFLRRFATACHLDVHPIRRKKTKKVKKSKKSCPLSDRFFDWLSRAGSRMPQPALLIRRFPHSNSPVRRGDTMTQPFRSVPTAKVVAAQGELLV